MVRNISIVCFLVFLFFGCASPSIKPIEIPKANFEKTPDFVLENTIQKPPKPKEILLDKNFNKTEIDPEYIAFSIEEFSKIVAVSRSFDAQKEVIRQLTNLVNLKINEINSLKELIATKELLAEHIAMLYVTEQELRQMEKRNFIIEKIMDKTFLIIQAGVIIALAVVM